MSNIIAILPSGEKLLFKLTCCEKCNKRFSSSRNCYAISSLTGYKWFYQKRNWAVFLRREAYTQKGEMALSILPKDKRYLLGGYKCQELELEIRRRLVEEEIIKGNYKDADFFYKEEATDPYILATAADPRETPGKIKSAILYDEEGAVTGVNTKVGEFKTRGDPLIRREVIQVKQQHKRLFNDSGIVHRKNESIDDFLLVCARKASRFLKTPNLYGDEYMRKQRLDRKIREIYDCWFDLQKKLRSGKLNGKKEEDIRTRANRLYAAIWENYHLVYPQANSDTHAHFMAVFPALAGELHVEDLKRKKPALIKRRLQEIYSSLSEKERTAYILHKTGSSQREIQEYTGMGSNAVSDAIQKGKEADLL